MNGRLLRRERVKRAIGQLLHDTVVQQPLQRLVDIEVRIDTESSLEIALDRRVDFIEIADIGRLLGEHAIEQQFLFHVLLGRPVGE